jgi:hypothetical protein
LPACSCQKQPWPEPLPDPKLTMHRSKTRFQSSVFSSQSSDKSADCIPMKDGSRLPMC